MSSTRSLWGNELGELFPSGPSGPFTFPYARDKSGVEQCQQPIVNLGHPEAKRLGASEVASRMPIFNVAKGDVDGRACRDRQVIPTAETSVGAEMAPLERDNLEMHGRLDISAARNQLNWVPQYDLRKGIKAFASRIAGRQRPSAEREHVTVS